MAEVKEQSYAGVNVNHPSIVAGIQTLAKQGKGVGEISRVIGMPAEVVKRHAPQTRTDR